MTAAFRDRLMAYHGTSQSSLAYTPMVRAIDHSKLRFAYNGLPSPGPLPVLVNGSAKVGGRAYQFFPVAKQRRNSIPSARVQSSGCSSRWKTWLTNGPAGLSTFHAC
jgi:hypothetical protein